MARPPAYADSLKSLDGAFNLKWKKFASLDLGLTLIETAEMYGEGRTESEVCKAIAGRRNDVFPSSKVYPHNVSRLAMQTACANSLRRLKTDRIDPYLLHWSGSAPLAETVDAFDRLQQARRPSPAREFSALAYCDPAQPFARLDAATSGLRER